MCQEHSKDKSTKPTWLIVDPSGMGSKTKPAMAEVCKCIQRMMHTAAVAEETGPAKYVGNEVICQTRPVTTWKIGR